MVVAGGIWVSGPLAEKALEPTVGDGKVHMDPFSTTDSEEGASIVEYAFVVLLIAIVAIVAVTIAGREVSDSFSTMASGLVNANSN